MIELLLGIWAMRRPEATLAVLITIIGLWAVLTGVIYCALAFEIRRTAQALASTADLTERDAAQIAGRLDRLARLHADGMLSTEEYTQLKASLLAASTSAQAGPSRAARTAAAPEVARVRSTADPDVRSVKGTPARAPRLAPDPVRNREAPQCGRA